MLLGKQGAQETGLYRELSVSGHKGYEENI